MELVSSGDSSCACIICFICSSELCIALSIGSCSSDRFRILRVRRVWASGVFFRAVGSISIGVGHRRWVVVDTITFEYNGMGTGTGFYGFTAYLFSRKKTPFLAS